MGKDNCDLIPLGNRVVLKKLIVEKTKSGIYMPDKDTIKLSEGLVVEVGPSVQRVKVGDRVLFGKHTATDVERNDETFSVIYESSIECKINPEKTDKDNLVKKEI